jgi:hypothetical protein
LTVTPRFPRVKISNAESHGRLGLVYLDLEAEHLAQERGGGRKIVNL